MLHPLEPRHDGPVAYWGPKGATLQPHWYSPSGPPEEMARRAQGQSPTRTPTASPSHPKLGQGNVSEGIPHRPSPVVIFAVLKPVNQGDLPPKRRGRRLISAVMHLRAPATPAVFMPLVRPRAVLIIASQSVAGGGGWSPSGLAVRMPAFPGVRTSGLSAGVSGCVTRRSSGRRAVAAGIKQLVQFVVS